MKEEVYIHRSLQAGSTARHAGPHKETPGFVQEAEQAKEKHGRKVLSQFPWEKPGKAGEVGLGLAS